MMTNPSDPKGGKPADQDPKASKDKKSEPRGFAATEPPIGPDR